jgi:hypothetical protein
VLSSIALGLKRGIISIACSFCRWPGPRFIGMSSRITMLCVHTHTLCSNCAVVSVITGIDLAPCKVSDMQVPGH